MMQPPDRRAYLPANPAIPRLSIKLLLFRHYPALSGRLFHSLSTDALVRHSGFTAAELDFIIH